MRWLADECVDAMLVTRLRGAGHDTVYMAEVAQSTSDVDIIAWAQREDRLLLTEDKDFGELVFRWRAALPGLVLLRIDPRRHELKWKRLKAAVDRYGQSLMGKYTVVEEARLRTRPLLTVLR